MESLSAPSSTQRPPNFYGLSRGHLAEGLAGQGVPRYRADQIYSWVYQKHRRSPAGMTNLPAVLRERFDSLCDLELPEVASVLGTHDALTHKFVLRLADGARVESVSMRTEKRLT